MKPVIHFEPFETEGKEFLVPATHHDDHALWDVGLDDLSEPVMEWRGLQVWERFKGIPLSVANLLKLESVCEVRISQQTIDK